MYNYLKKKTKKTNNFEIIQEVVIIKLFNDKVNKVIK